MEDPGHLGPREGICVGKCWQSLVWDSSRGAVPIRGSWRLLGARRAPLAASPTSPMAGRWWGPRRAPLDLRRSAESARHHDRCLHRLRCATLLRWRPAWFVPSDSDQRRAPTTGEVVVTRTRDGGQSFDILREGLPQQLAYDLVLRHALSIHEDGEQLAFGSSTGHLWVTTDQGDHWHAVAGHLPPIYAVTHVC